MAEKSDVNIDFLAHKVFLHHWPHDTPKWADSTTQQIEQNINKNKNKKSISITNEIIKIENYPFTLIKKVGLTIPMFQKQATLIFGGHCKDFDAHVHITTKEDNYLEIFNQLASWRNRFYPESVSG